MDVEQRARAVFGLSWADYWMERGQPDVAHDFDAFSRAEAWALQHFHSAITPPEGHVVVTRNEAGQAMAVTRQDGEGRILSVIAEFEAPEGWVEQHARDSRELRSLCAARDEARKERDLAKNQSTRMRAALKKIAAYKLDQFAGPYDMASACIYDAENALPDDPEVRDGRG